MIYFCNKIPDASKLNKYMENCMHFLQPFDVLTVNISLVQ